MTDSPKDPRVEAAVGAWDALRRDRSEDEREWDEIAALIRTERGGHRTADPGQHRQQRPLDGAGLIAAEHMAAGVYGTLTNPSNTWFRLALADPELDAAPAARAWLDQAGARVLRSFGAGAFYDQAITLYGDIVAFGNAAQYDELPRGERAVLDVTLSLAEVAWDVDGYGRVTEVARRFKLTPMQAAARWGREALPAKLQERLDKAPRERTTWFHHVVRNDGYRPGTLGRGGKPWRSVYVSETGEAVVSERGFDEMPFYVPRWHVETGRVCGRGPAFKALSGARKLELMTAANLRAGQRAGDPVILAPDRQAWPLSGRIRPGGIVYGGVDEQGRRMLQEFGAYTGTGLTLEMAQAAIEEIRDAFHWSLMQLAGRTGMTATEVIERQEEKLRLMAPHLGRVQSEYLAPKVARRFAMLWRAGQIPPPPPEIGGAEVRIEYTSAAAMAQRSAEGAAAVRLVQDLAPLAQIDPAKAARLSDRLDEDAFAEVLLEARGAPGRLLRPREEADARAQARAEAAQAQQLAQLAQTGGGLARDLSAAGLIGEGAA